MSAALARHAAPDVGAADRAWPDWRGQACAIIASGPSANRAPLGALQGRVRVLAIKRSWELAPFADAVYGCDGPWWQSVQGLKSFAGLRLGYDTRTVDEFGLKRVRIPDKHGDALLFGETGVVGAGGNSGFQALNLAAQWGADRILLVGFDLHARGGVHWYGRNTAWRMGNPDESNFARWKTAFDAAAPVLAARGVRVLNASPRSEIRGFEHAGVDEALQRWGLT